MGEEINKKLKAKALECALSCICQTESGAPGCKITGTVSGTVFFTESRHPGGCPQQHSFGSTFICTCPVRQSLFIKKNI